MGCRWTRRSFGSEGSNQKWNSSRKGVSHKFILGSDFGQIDLNDFIDYPCHINCVQDDAKEFSFDPGGDSVWTVYAHQPRVYWNVCILIVRTGFIGGASEICAVSSDEDPVVIQDELLQLPVLPSALPSQVTCEFSTKPRSRASSARSGLRHSSIRNFGTSSTCNPPLEVSSLHIQ